MYKGPIKNHLNMDGASLCLEALAKAINLSGLTWGMPPAQVFAVHCLAFQSVTVLTEEGSNIFNHTQTATYMFGLPVEIDRDLPQGTVQLRYQGAVLFEIQSLAVPKGFED